LRQENVSCTYTKIATKKNLHEEKQIMREEKNLASRKTILRQEKKSCGKNKIVLSLYQEKNSWNQKLFVGGDFQGDDIGARHKALH